MSRQGKAFSCPAWFTQGLPRVHLDGELWMGRRTLEQLVAIVNSSQQDNDNWKRITYVVFDLPKSEATFEGRMEELKQLALPPHVYRVEHEPCRDNDHLLSRLKEVAKQGGEGLMLNEPKSKYVGERTRSLLKVKVDRSLRSNVQPENDSEVQLLEVLPIGLYCLQ